MSVLTLQRKPYQTGHATFGELYSEQGRREVVTLELPWKDNARNVSCIPAGEYTAERYFSPHHGCTVFKLIDVPNRDDVELHVGNTVADSKGCILLGLDFGDVKGQLGIVGSKAAFLSFMADHPERCFTLHVVDAE